jgi:hypothetical protein
MAQGGAAILIQGSRGVGRPNELDWCGNVKSITVDPAHPEYCQGDCTGKGSMALRGVAPRRSPVTRRRT